MCKVLESKKPRTVKYATPILLDVQTHTGEENLVKIATNAFLAETNLGGTGEEAEMEETKEDLTSDVAARVKRILSLLNAPTKKAPAVKSNDFRSFLKKQ